MPNLQEEIKYRASLDTTNIDSALASVPKKASRVGTDISRELGKAGDKAGEQFQRQFDSRVKKGMTLLGGYLGRYFGDIGRLFSEVLMIGREMKEILPSKGSSVGGTGHIVAEAGAAGSTLTAQGATQKSIGNTFDNFKRSAVQYKLVTPGGKLVSPSADSKAAGAVGGRAVGAATGAAAGAGALGGIAAGGILPALAIGAAVAGLTYFIMKAYEARQEVKQLAGQMRITDDLAKTFLAAGKATGNLDGFLQRITKLVDLLEQARRGSIEAQAALSKVGLKSPYITTDVASKQLIEAVENAPNQLEADKITMRAGLRPGDMDQVRIEDLERQKTAIGKTLRTSSQIMSAEELAINATKLDQIAKIQAKINNLRNTEQTLILREAAAYKDIQQEDNKVKDAAELVKATQERVAAERELSRVGKDDIEVAKEKHAELMKQHAIDEEKLINAKSLKEIEVAKTNLAKTKLAIANEEADIARLEFEANRKIIEQKERLLELEDDIKDVKLNAAGGLNLSELEKTDTPAGREANRIAQGEVDYNNAIARGDRAGADRIRKGINASKLDLVKRGILSPNELDFSDPNINKLDVLADIENFRRGAPTPDEMMKANKVRSSDANWLNKNPLPQLGTNATPEERMKYLQSLNDRFKVGKGLSNQTDFIRGVRKSDIEAGIKDQAASLLDLINRNGGAMPTTVRIL